MKAVTWPVELKNDLPAMTTLRMLAAVDTKVLTDKGPEATLLEKFPTSTLLFASPI